MGLSLWPTSSVPCLPLQLQFVSPRLLQIADFFASLTARDRLGHVTGVKVSD